MGSDTVRAVLDRCGTTCAEEAGIRLADGQAALFRLLVAPSSTTALDGAGRAGLPGDPQRLTALVDGDDLARPAAALVRVSLLAHDADPLADPA